MEGLLRAGEIRVNGSTETTNAVSVIIARARLPIQQGVTDGSGMRRRHPGCSLDVAMASKTSDNLIRDACRCILQLTIAREGQ